MTTAADREREAEQRYVTVLYDRLDELRARTSSALARVLRSPTSGTPAARSERDAFATLHSDRLAQLNAVEGRLCFGRLDMVDGERRYIGRIGLSDEAQTQLLVDWRAPGAEAFYQATAADPAGVIRRRQLATRGRVVTGIEDEVLDLEALDAAAADSVTGEGALFIALNEARTGRMRDIVATIQAEQDRVIRSPLGGVLVVQGGPGTGKTAVALHRAAYLLYAYRERIARSGVLLVGPNRIFLRYIEQVLPSLGETGAVMATPGQLLPGLDATGREANEVAAVKGDLRMASVMANAVRNRQRVPDAPRVLDVDGTQITLRPADVEFARSRARRSRRPHNDARLVFVRTLLGTLAQRLATAQGTELDEHTRPEIEGALRESRDVRREVNLCWLPATPQQLLAELYRDPERLRAAAPTMSHHDRELLRRADDTAWTPADVPLLDELAELLGAVDDSDHAETARLAAERRREREYARAVLEMSGTGDMLDAESLVERYAGTARSRSVSERAAEDREWTFGHVVVDEAQELSPMQWRLLMRRCPGKSMTVVGDIAQTGALAGAHSWAEALDPHVEGRWRLEQLSVNYRTPQRVMDVASAVLAAAGIETVAPESARDTDWPPVAERVDAAGGRRALLAAVAGAVDRELTRLGEGTLAVLTARVDVDEVAQVLAEALPPGTVGISSDALQAKVSVLSVAEVKGLEFDTVVLVEPARIVGESPRGVNDLYVALTRPTQRLHVVHADALPTGLEGLSEA